MTCQRFSMDDAPQPFETAAEDLPFEADLESEWAELATRSVGRLSLSAVRDHVTKTMLAAALARVNHNYSRAAELLCITRQSVQYLVARHELQPPVARAASGSTLRGPCPAPVRSGGAPSSARG
jgi:transcriptional regulator with GAF, ATPase, and Fis domain